MFVVLPFGFREIRKKALRHDVLLLWRFRPQPVSLSLEADMFALLSPRLWIFIAIAAALTFSHFTAYRKGRNAVQLEWTASVAQANDDARRLEQQRQRRADDSARLGAIREDGIRAAADRARSAASGLRDALNTANRQREESQAAATARASAIGELLGQCAAAHGELAEKADRHVNDIRTLLDAWPQ